MAIKFLKTQTSKYFMVEMVELRWINVTIYLICLHVRYNNDIFYFLARKQLFISLERG